MENAISSLVRSVDTRRGMVAVIVLCLTALIAPVLAADAQVDSPAVVPPDGWRLVWNDEFDLTNGSRPDLTKWNYDSGSLGWGNNELEYYTSRTNNAWIENGQLVIQAQVEKFEGNKFTSARLSTRGKEAWTYGRFEARIKLPRGQGVWPTFWMLGTNIDSVHWPACGEIDIMENVGKEPDVVHGTVHGPGYSAGNGIGAPVKLPDGAAVSDAFHIFAVECEPDHITWFLDSRPYFTVTPANLPENTRWVFNEPKFILLNVAIGGFLPGNPDSTTKFPQRMLVDYVRVYEKTLPADPASHPKPANKLGE
jgi:beta-glucanase (GH16 family)